MDVNTTTKTHPTLDEFTKTTGIKVNYTEDYNDNNEFYAKVRPLLAAGADTGRDMWVSTGPFPVWWTHGLAARFNREKKEWARHAVALPRSTRQKRLPLSLTTIGR
jgi:hypothetical protein